jgi:hypothetical protein
MVPPFLLVAVHHSLLVCRKFSQGRAFSQFGFCKKHNVRGADGCHVCEVVVAGEKAFDV